MPAAPPNAVAADSRPIIRPSRQRRWTACRPRHAPNALDEFREENRRLLIRCPVGAGQSALLIEDEA